MRVFVFCKRYRGNVLRSGTVDLARLGLIRENLYRFVLARYLLLYIFTTDFLRLRRYFVRCNRARSVRIMFSNEQIWAKLQCFRALIVQKREK